MPTAARRSHSAPEALRRPRRPWRGLVPRVRPRRGRAARGGPEVPAGPAPARRALDRGIYVRSTRAGRHCPAPLAGGHRRAQVRCPGHHGTEGRFDRQDPGRSIGGRWAMDASLIVVAVVVTALVFDFTNGFHDTANAMATSIATGALRPRTAVALSAVLNLLGAFLSIKVAATIASGIVSSTAITLPIVFAALLGAITWN